MYSFRLSYESKQSESEHRHVAACIVRVTGVFAQHPHTAKLEASPMRTVLPACRGVPRDPPRLLRRDGSPLGYLAVLKPVRWKFPLEEAHRKSNCGEFIPANSPRFSDAVSVVDVVARGKVGEVGKVPGGGSGG